MATSRVYLSGGPCNGRTVPATEIQGGLVGYISCGGGYYIVDGNNRRANGDLIFKYAGTTNPSPPGGAVTGSGGAPQALGGWNSLRIAMNRGLPAALRAMNRNQKAALQELAHKRRVRH